MHGREHMVQVHRDRILSIEIRRLHPSEFDLLKEVDDGYTPSPDHSIAIVARNERRIIGRLFCLAPAHCEGIWIDESYRGGSLFKDLMTAMEIEANAEGMEKLFAYAVKPEIGFYLEKKCGYSKLPWSVWSKDLA